MLSLDPEQLTPKQRAMVALWEEHLRAEMQDKDAHASCDAIVANPYVNHVAVLTGGVGRRQLENYYSRHFIPRHPPGSSQGHNYDRREYRWRPYDCRLHQRR